MPYDFPIMTIEERNQPITQGFFTDAMENLTHMINASFQALEDRMATKLDLAALTERVGGLEKSIMGMHDYFTAIFAELREIREEIKTIDTRAEVADLQIRVTVLEDKVRVKKPS
jgi:hypothetical protein